MTFHREQPSTRGYCTQCGQVAQVRLATVLSATGRRVQIAPVCDGCASMYRHVVNTLNHADRRRLAKQKPAKGRAR